MRRCEKFVGLATPACCLPRAGPSRFPSRLAPGLRPAGATKLFFSQLLSGWWIAVALGAFLRLYQLSDPSFWLDEVATALQSRQSAASIIFSPVHAVYPPLYFLLLHLLPVHGTGEWILRLPSALAGTLNIPLIYLLGQRLFNRATGLVAAFLLALAPFHIYFSQEARPYAIVMALLTAALLFFVRWLQTERAREAWISAGLLIIGAYIQIVTALSILALNLFMLAYRPKPSILKTWLKTQAALALCLMPYIFLSMGEYLFFWNSSHQLGIEKPLPLLKLFWAVGTVALNLAQGFTFTWRGFGSPIEAADLWARAAAKIPFLLVFIPLAWRGWRILEKEAAAARSLRYLLLAPVVCTFLISLRINWFMVNHLSVLFPPLCLLLALGLIRSARPWNRLAGGAVGALWLIALAHYYFDPAYLREPWRSVAQYVQKQAQPGDGLLFDAPHVRPAYEYYASRALPTADLGQHVPLSSQELQELRWRLSPYSRVWLILSHNLKTGPYYSELFRNWSSVRERRPYPKIDLYLFSFKS